MLTENVFDHAMQVACDTTPNSVLGDRVYISWLGRINSAYRCYRLILPEEAVNKHIRFVLYSMDECEASYNWKTFENELEDVHPSHAKIGRRWKMNWKMCTPPTLKLEDVGR